jgi:hypothetical protein
MRRDFYNVRSVRPGRQGRLPLYCVPLCTSAEPSPNTASRSDASSNPGSPHSRCANTGAATANTTYSTSASVTFTNV